MSDDKYDYYHEGYDVGYDRGVYVTIKRVEELEANLVKAVEALEFYGNEDHYSGEYISDECGCCGSWYEPKIHKDGEDSGDLARTTLAEIKGENDDH